VTRRVTWIRNAVGIFAILFLTNAWFHQGGGWNQNARFDQVRALIEQRELHIDDYLLYSFDFGYDGASRYERVPMLSETTSLNRLPYPNTLDISLRDGHYFPNKPPGTLLLAAPVYAALYLLERSNYDMGATSVLVFNYYIVTLATAGLWGALGGVALFWLSSQLFPGARMRSHVAASLSLGLGTLWLPYSTMLFDHVIVGSLALFAVLAVHVSTGAGTAKRGRPFLWALAGTLAGSLVVLNYSGVILTVAIGLYALWRSGSAATALTFAAGGSLPAVVLAGFNAASFGDPLALAHEGQLEVFVRPGVVFWMLGVPSFSVLTELLVLPYRGLFWYSPVLLLSGYGLLRLLRSARHRPEGVLIAGVFLTYWLFNGSMPYAWHGGSAVGPRYLMPAIPLLALTLVPAFDLWPRTATLMAIVSCVIVLGVTTVDPQVDVSIENPFSEFYLPLASGERVVTGGYRIEGPVSAHPIGVPGAGFEVADGSSRLARWNSFNLGEFFFERSWLSLLPLFAGWGLLALALIRLGDDVGNGALD
jgi:hypothetical protein